MPQPYPIGDERAFVDWLQNANEQGPGPTPTGLQGQQYSIVAATVGINTTETVLQQAQVIPILSGNAAGSGTLKVATKIRFYLSGTSTATVANTTTFNVYIGTTGTIASDTKAFVFTTSASGTTGTAVPFVVYGDINVRTVGTAATGFGTAMLVANAATAIAGAVTNVISGVQNATFNTNTAVFITVSSVTAATTTTNTFQQATIEVLP